MQKLSPSMLSQLENGKMIPTLSTFVSTRIGAQQSSDNILRINDLPSSSQTIMVEGMDATNGTARCA